MKNEQAMDRGFYAASYASDWSGGRKLLSISDVNTSRSCIVPYLHYPCLLGQSCHRRGYIVVWADTRSGTRDIHAYNLATDALFPICIHPAHQCSPAISAEIVTWMGLCNGYEDNTKLENRYGLGSTAWFSDQA